MWALSGVGLLVLNIVNPRLDVQEALLVINLYVLFSLASPVRTKPEKPPEKS